MFVMSKSLLQEVEKSLTENRLAYFKKEILAVLDKQEEKDFQKSLSYYITESVKFGVKKSLYSNQVYSILKSLRESA